LFGNVKQFIPAYAEVGELENNPENNKEWLSALAGRTGDKIITRGILPHDQN